MRTRSKKIDWAPRYRQVMTANLAVCLACLAGLMWPLGALAETFTLTQITRTTFPAGSGAAAIDAAGTRIAFLSSADLTGGNPDGNFEIFLFDTTTSSFTQITNTSGSTVFFQPIQNLSPTINATGTRIAFQSNANLTGGNADGNREIFLFDTTTGTFTQITNTSTTSGGGESFSPAINADGTRITFESASDLTGGNADGNREIFLFDTTTGTYTQITNTSGFVVLNIFATNVAPTINAAGTRIAFVSNANLTGEAGGSGGIFLFDTTSGTFTRIATGGNAPSINADGTYIAFQSFGNFTGGNADGNQEIFLFDTTTSTFTQITNTTGPVISEAPRINAGGTRIAFVSNADLTGGNADGNHEIFLFDTPSGAMIQVTDSTGGFNGTGGQSISADGTRIAFGSSRNLTGNNPDGNGELFFASSSGGNPVIAPPPPPPPVIPTLSEWGQLSMTGLFLLGFLWALRRRSD